MKKLFLASLIFSNLLFAQVGSNLPYTNSLPFTISNGGEYAHFTLVSSFHTGYPVQEQIILIGDPNDAQHSCYMMLYQQSTVMLLNDTGDGWLGNFPVGSNNTMENLKCKVEVFNSQFGTQGPNGLSFAVNAHFKSPIIGTRSVWGFTGDSNWQSNPGWFLGGSFAVNAPTISGLTPVNGNALTQTFSITATDPMGAGNISYVSVGIGAFWGANSATIVSYPNSHGFILLNDAGNGWIQSPYNNTQVQITNPTWSVSGNTATIGFTATGLPAFAGAHPIGAQVVNNSDQITIQSLNIGTWTVPTVNMSLTATEINTHELLLDDATGQYIERPTSISPWIVRLKNGKNVHVAAADNVRVKNISHSWEPVGDSFVYHFKIDTTGAPYIMRLGITEDQYVPIGESSEQTQPKGWHGLVQAWANLGEAELSETSEFSLKSKWKPGLQALFIMSDKAKEPIPSFPETENNVRIAAAASIFNNSVRKFVIGPAIDPALTEEGLKDLVQRWVEDYGFGFLGPYLSGTSFADLKTDDPFEQEILNCLKAAVAQ